jgi:hypothetical protein
MGAPTQNRARKTVAEKSSQGEIAVTTAGVRRFKANKKKILDPADGFRPFTTQSNSQMQPLRPLTFGCLEIDWLD